MVTSTVLLSGLHWVRQYPVNFIGLAGIVYAIVYKTEPIFTGILHGKLSYPDSKIHGANMGPTWVLSALDGPHVGPMDLAIRVFFNTDTTWDWWEMYITGRCMNYSTPPPNPRYWFDGLVQDCSIASALAMEILQSCAKPLDYSNE